MDVFSFDDIKELYRKLSVYEKVDLYNCKFIKDGKEFEIPIEVINRFTGMGLMNRDLALSDYLIKMISEELK